MKDYLILVVDDEELVLETINAQLSSKLGDRYRLEFALSASEAIEMIEEYANEGILPALVISDQIMPNMKGDEFFITLHQKYPKTMKIMLTGHAGLESAVNAINHADLFRYLTKPWEEEDFLLTIEKAIQQYFLIENLEIKNKELQEEIKERIKAEEKILEQAILLDISTDAILVQDNSSDKITYSNKAAREIYGWTEDEILTKSASILMDPEHLQQYQDALKTVQKYGKWSGDLYHRTQSGDFLFVESRWTAMRSHNKKQNSILMVNTDVTEKRKIQMRIQRSQRLESLGTLASSFAHDLNNILTPIRMANAMLKKDYCNSDNNFMFESVEEAVMQSRDLINQILEFARGSKSKSKDINLDLLVHDLIKFGTDTIFPSSIKIETNFPENLWTIKGDRAQLHQIFLNICVNARDAMPDGGVLRIKGSNVNLDCDYVTDRFTVPENAYVVVNITDTGSGIKQDLIDKIYEPFFSTKDDGKGSGIGLWTVFNNIKNHDAFIEVNSKPGRGTNFKLYFPVVEDVHAERKPSLKTSVIHINRFTVLIIEDNASYRSFIKELLETFNYDTIAAGNGKEALEFYEKYYEEIEVVVVDMQLPVMDGATTITQLRKINPSLKIIPISGLPIDSYRDVLSESDLKLFLEKPFRTDSLIEKLQPLCLSLQ